MRRLLSALIVLAWPVVAAAPAFADVVGDCSVTFNGVTIDRIENLGSPLELGARDRLVFTGTAPQGTGSARVLLLAGPVEIDSATTEYAAPSNEFAVELDLGELAPYAVGLYRVRGEVDGCTAEAWLRITGRFPLATLAGLTGAGLLVAGLAGQLGAFASRRKWAAAGAAAAGVLTGTGAAVLGQQFGRLQPSFPALVGCIAAAALLGYGVARVAGAAARERRRQRPKTEPAKPARASDTERAGGVAESHSVSRPAPAAATPAAPPAVPFWGYVLSDVDVFDLTDHTRVVGTLRPGNWYLIKREVGPWVHVAGNPEPEGWAASHAINRQG